MRSRLCGRAWRLHVRSRAGCGVGYEPRSRPACGAGLWPRSLALGAYCRAVAGSFVALGGGSSSFPALRYIAEVLHMSRRAFVVPPRLGTLRGCGLFARVWPEPAWVSGTWASRPSSELLGSLIHSCRVPLAFRISYHSLCPHGLAAPSAKSRGKRPDGGGHGKRSPSLVTLARRSGPFNLHRVARVGRSCLGRDQT